MAQIAYVDWDGLVYYDSKIKKHIADKLEACLKDGGRYVFEELPKPSYDLLNFTYLVTNSFVSDENFEIRGLSYPAGTTIKVSETSPSIYQFTILNEKFSSLDRDALENINDRLDALEEKDFIETSDIVDILSPYMTAEEVKKLISSIPETDLSNYVTKEELQEALNTIDIPEVDLSDYATKEYVDNKLNPINTSISYINENITNLTNAVNELNEDVDNVHEELHDLETEITKADFASKEYVSSEIARAKLEAADVDLSAYYTKTEVDAKVAPLATNAEVTALNTRVSDLGTVVSSVSDGALKHEQDISALTTEVNNIKTSAATKEELEAVQNVAGQNSVKLFQIDSDLVDINAKLDTIPTKTSELINDSNFLTEHQDISNKADKATTLAGYGITDAYTRTQIDEKLSEISSGGGNVDLEGFVSEDEWNERISAYATEDWVANQGYLTKHQDISHLALKSEIPGNVSELKNDAGYITAADIPETITLTDVADAGFIKSNALEGYAKSEDIPSLDDYAKKTDIPDISTKLDTSVYNSDKEKFALKSEIPSDYLVEADLADYAKTSDIPTDYLTQDDLNGYSKFSGSYNDLTDKPEIPSITGLASEQWVKDQGYLTEHQSLEEYAKKSDLPDISGKLDSATYNSEKATFALKSDIPTDYITDSELESKANNVLFNEDYYVNNAIGQFNVAESVKGLTIKEILIKLLDLKQSIKYSLRFMVDGQLYHEAFYEANESIKLPETDPIKEGYIFHGWKVDGIYLTNSFVMPAYNVEAYAEFIAKPDESESIITDIMENEIPMYSVTTDGELAEVPYTLVDPDAEPTVSGFFTITDDSNAIIKAGYQDLSIKNDEMYYFVALPKEVDYNTMVEVETWDPYDKLWLKSELALTSDEDIINELADEVGVDLSHIDTNVYTIWTSEDVCTGSIIRYIIKEN